MLLFTYLMYMKQLDEAETNHEADFELIRTEYESLFPKDKPYLRWHHFKDIGSADKMYEIMNYSHSLRIYRAMENLLMQDL